MWIIKPNYNKEHICFYCGKNKAVADKENSTTLYKLVDRGKFTLSVNYIKVDVGIPRCEECKKRHDIAGRPSCLIFLAGCVGVIIYCIINGFPFKIESTENWFGILAVIGGVTLTWLAVSFLIGSLIRMSINAFMKGTKDEEDNESYPPIKKLMDIGFMDRKPDAAAHYGMQMDFDKKKLNDTFNLIVNDDNCIISSSK